jgi:transposase
VPLQEIPRCADSKVGVIRNLQGTATGTLRQAAPGVCLNAPRYPPKPKLLVAGQAVFFEEPRGTWFLFLARRARKLSWKETAKSFSTSWEKVFDAVDHLVSFGLEHRVFSHIDAIGVDEIRYAKGRKYRTVACQIDLGVTRLLRIGKERTIKSFRGFFAVLGDEVASQIAFVCSDMWEPCLKVIREKYSDALHIPDRFHIVAKMNKALDEIGAGESRRMAHEGLMPLLKKSRRVLFKREENLKIEQRFRLRDLLR